MTGQLNGLKSVGVTVKISSNVGNFRELDLCDITAEFESVYFNMRNTVTVKSENKCKCSFCEEISQNNDNICRKFRQTGLETVVYLAMFLQRLFEIFLDLI